MQKKLKTLGMVLLAFSLTTAVGVSVNTETASAKKVNAKTLKLKKKSLKIKVGDSKTLKTTVKPKKATLKWKTSKKKVVTVSKKGKVTAKAEGTAKITVTSGKKKATCTVTVKGYGKKAVSIKSVEVVNPKVVRVTLSKAKKLSLNDFAMAKKAYSDAKTTKKLTAASVNNSNNKVYELVLSTNYDVQYDDNRVFDEDYVSVTIKKLNGLKNKETVYYESTVPTNEYIGAKTGDVINKSIYYTATYRGYLSDVKVAGLPAGLQAEIHNHFVTIKGVPTAVANGTQATITAKDESGKSLTQKVLFYIGSDTQIVSYIPTENRTILANDDREESFRIRAYGGSGSYKYALINNTNKFISGEDYGEAYIVFDNAISNEAGQKEYLPAGKYNVTYSVTDSENSAITANGSLEVTAVNGIKLTGNVVASDNTPIGNADVSAWFKDVNHTFYNNSLETRTVSENYTDPLTKQAYTKGNYELVVYPSQAYSLDAYAGGARNGVENYNPGTANQVKNFVLPIYKVTFASTNLDVTKCWFSIKGVDGSGYKTYDTADAYLKKGTYMVDETIEDVVSHPDEYTTVYTTYKLTGTFTVAGNMTVNLTATKLSEETETTATQITAGVATKVWLTKDGIFTPAETGMYAIACKQEEQYVAVYDEAGNIIDMYDAKATADGYQIVIKDELTAGKKYTFHFGADDTVTVSKYVAPPTTED